MSTYRHIINRIGKRSNYSMYFPLSINPFPAAIIIHTTNMRAGLNRLALTKQFSKAISEKKAGKSNF